MTQDEFLAAAFQNPVNQTIVDELYTLALPDAWLVSGWRVWRPLLPMSFRQMPKALAADRRMRLEAQ